MTYRENSTFSQRRRQRMRLDIALAKLEQIEDLRGIEYA